jgi:hypothetical protein
LVELRRLQNPSQSPFAKGEVSVVSSTAFSRKKRFPGWPEIASLFFKRGIEGDFSRGLVELRRLQNPSQSPFAKGEVSVVSSTAFPEKRGLRRPEIANLSLR